MGGTVVPSLPLSEKVAGPKRKKRVKLKEGWMDDGDVPHSAGS